MVDIHYASLKSFPSISEKFEKPKKRDLKEEKFSGEKMMKKSVYKSDRKVSKKKDGGSNNIHTSGKQRASDVYDVDEEKVKKKVTIDEGVGADVVSSKVFFIFYFC